MSEILENCGAGEFPWPVLEAKLCFCETSELCLYGAPVQARLEGARDVKVSFMEVIGLGLQVLGTCRTLTRAKRIPLRASLLAAKPRRRASKPAWKSKGRGNNSGC